MNDKEAAILVRRIAEPTFKYLMKRIQKEILNHDDNKDLPLNMFLNIITAAIAENDANILRYLEVFHKISTNREIDFDALKLGFISRLEDNLKVLKR
jgi:hypothetical protein